RLPLVPALCPYTTLFRSGFLAGAGIFNRVINGFRTLAEECIVMRFAVASDPSRHADGCRAGFDECLCIFGINSAVAHKTHMVERSEEHTSELQSRENLVC